MSATGDSDGSGGATATKRGATAGGGATVAGHAKRVRRDPLTDADATRPADTGTSDGSSGSDDSGSGSDDSGSGSDDSNASDTGSSDSDASEAAAPELHLDQYGRLVGVAGPSVQLTFKAWRNALDFGDSGAASGRATGSTSTGAGAGAGAGTRSGGKGSTPAAAVRGAEALERMRDDCRLARSAKSRDADAGDYSEGHTYFIPSDAEPRCTLERYALRVFQFHTRDLKAVRQTEGGDDAGADAGAGARAGDSDAGAAKVSDTYDPSRSGAEWWTLYMHGEDDVAFHWDKDYGLEEQLLSVHPALGTVTYLCDGGAPTMVVAHRESVQLGEDFSGTPETAYLSRPRTGKHMVFDGSMLHAAPAELATEAWPKKRVTLLVNVWLNHSPTSSRRLKARVAAKMSNFEPPFTLLRDLGRAVTEAGDAPRVIDVPAGKAGGDSGDGAGTEECVWTFGDGGIHSVRMKFPKAAVAAETVADCFQLRFPESGRPVVKF